MARAARGRGRKKTTKQMRKRLFAGLSLLAAASIGVGLLLSPRAPSPPAYPDYGALVAFDPTREGGHLLPNLDLLVQGEQQGRGVRFITNSQGFRSRREFTLEPQPGVPRALFLGDSFVDGMRTDQDETIGYLLEADLARDHPRAEVLIAGHNNPANAWYYWQEHGHHYQPSVVILGVTLGNDLTWTSYGTTLVPATALDGSVRLRLVPPLRQASPRYASLALPEAAYQQPSRWEAWHDRELALRKRLSERSWFAQTVPPLIAPGASRRRQVPAADFLVSLILLFTPPTAEAATLFAEFEDVLLGFDRAVRDLGSQLLVVFFPVRAQVSPRDWGLLVRAYSLEPSKFDLDYSNQRLVGFCQRSGLRCVDLLPALRLAHEDHGPLYRGRGDMHFNEAGQALAATEIAAALRKQGLLRQPN